MEKYNRREMSFLHWKNGNCSKSGQDFLEPDYNGMEINKYMELCDEMNTKSWLNLVPM